MDGDGARCGRCGNATIVSDGKRAACVVCGAGVTYKFKRNPYRRKRGDHESNHVHEYRNYLGVTFETGERKRKDGCTSCPAVRLTDLDAPATEPASPDNARSRRRTSQTDR